MDYCSKLLLSGGLLFGLATSSTAATVDIELLDVFDVADEVLTYDFTGLFPAAGNDATLTIRSGGSVSGFDGLDIADLGDFFDLSFDGTAIGGYSCDGNSGTTVIPINNGNTTDCQFTLELTTLGLGYDFNSAVADGSFVVSIDLAPGVNFAEDMDQVFVRLQYEEIAAVPLPAAGWLLLGGLGAVAVARRRRQG